MAEEFLPPPNPNALGLHVTDNEWRLLRDLIETDAAITEARVFGSRQTGLRRNPDKPLDIDLAIAVWSDDPTPTNVTEFWDTSARLERRAGGLLRLHIEDLTYATATYARDMQAGVLIIKRER